jgi:CPA2 family monovalent cation:H+ antiporter-2
VPETLIVLVFFIAFAALFDRLRLGTVLGFLLGGVAIGPSALGVIQDLHAVHTLAELGVVFLLFTLGMELKFERLRLFEARVYILAVTQLLVTAVVFAAVAHAVALPPERAVIVGGALALSSTAVVLQVLRDWGRTLTQLGRMAIAILLVQDIAVGPLLVLVEVMGEGGGSIWLGLLTALMRAAIVLLVVVLTARYLLRPLFEFVATIEASEVFTATALLVVLGASFATEAAGLSMALGAFVAGLMVADTEYRHQVAADIAPFRGLLLGFFFMTVGMTVDIGFAATHLGAILLVTLAVILVKGLLLGGLAIGLGYPHRLSLLLGGLLSQGSEFAFVLLGLAATSGLFADSDVQLLTIAVALSMAITPVAAAAIRGHVNRLEGEAAASLSDLVARTAELRNHVLVIGFGQVGKAVTRHLVGLRIPVLALDYDPKRVRASKRLPVFFGNAARPDVLKAAHVGQARLVIVALSSTDTTERVVSLVRKLCPKQRLIARSPDDASVARLRKAGADAVVLDSLTTALDMAQRAILLYEPEEITAAFGAAAKPSGQPVPAPVIEAPAVALATLADLPEIQPLPSALAAAEPEPAPAPAAAVPPPALDPPMIEMPAGARVVAARPPAARPEPAAAAAIERPRSSAATEAGRRRKRQKVSG